MSREAQIEISNKERRGGITRVDGDGLMKDFFLSALPMAKKFKHSKFNWPGLSLRDIRGQSQAICYPDIENDGGDSHLSHKFEALN